jgi:hypothetical protein
MKKLMFVLIAFSLLISFTNAQAQVLDDSVPPNLKYWPEQEYILEIQNAMLAEGASHIQYYGKHKMRLDTSIGDVSNTVIYHFNENDLTEIIILPDEEMYMKSKLSYYEFFETSDASSSLFYNNMPGEEMAMYGANKIGEEKYLDRNMEWWLFIDDSEGEEVKIEMLLDRELRQIVKMLVDGEMIFEVVNITIGNIPEETFNPPADFEVMSY